LSPNRRTNGGLVVWPLDGSEPQQVELEPGDVVVMDPDLPHTSGLNREGAIRYAVYFRFLEEA
jgi:ectoine hydroxylase-related dioxygenase (phytanoyl-CoA dioxygenase family)